MLRQTSRFDAPFWTVLLAGVIGVGTLGCFGLAYAAGEAAHADYAIVRVE